MESTDPRINPFSNYGSIAFGSRFFGRKKEIKFFTDRIFGNSLPQDISIIGAPKIGKSSLVHEAIIERKQELYSNKKIPIWINMATFGTPESFFSGIIFLTYAELESLSIINKEINEKYSKINDEKLSEMERYYYIEKFYEAIKKLGYNIIFIFDEFDQARNIFKGNPSAFQKLRELTYNPDWKTTHITISRRSLREIEQQSGAISNYYSLFHEKALISYTDEDLIDYFQKLENCGLKLTKEQHNKIEHYCGSHPYLLDIACYHILEQFYDKTLEDIDTTVRSNENIFLNYYEDVEKHLRENSTFNNLLQVLFGPLVTVNRRDIDRLRKYGYLSQSSAGSIVSLSQDFKDFLYFTQRKTELWPVLSQVERGLRELIDKQMTGKYGVNWIDQIEKVNAGLKNTFKECRDNQQKEKAFFGSASENLLDYTYIGTLFTIIFFEWGIFQNIMRKDKNYWDQHQKIIVKIRNPLAHFRDEVPPESHKKIADGYCQEILDILRHEKIL